MPISEEWLLISAKLAGGQLAGRTNSGRGGR
jgi:hypothetical protein